MRKRTNIRAHRHRDTGSKLLVKLLDVQVEHLPLPLCFSGRRGMTGKVLRDGKGRHGEDLLLPHDSHRLVAQLVGVIDRRDARPRGIQRARLARRMHRNALAGPCGFLDRGAEFGFGVLVRRGKPAVAK